MNEQKNNNGRGIFYGVIGVATLVVAIIGATFAYFTATATNNNTITGNAATISFTLNVKKVTKADAELGGMIPMSNSMVETAVHGTYPGATGGATKTDTGATTGHYSSSNICTDDNGNAVCQVYKITVQNTGSASMFIDGYVSLTGGSGDPEDNGKTAQNKTTMRWAQVFCTGTDDALTSCTTAGTTTTAATGITAWSALDDAGTTKDGFYAAAVKTGNALASAGVTGTGTLSGNSYDIINTNYIRISDHSASATRYTRTEDMTSALVLNQTLAPSTGNTTLTTASDSTTSVGLTDAKVMYIVVWLSENGHNQSVGAETTNAATAAANFFQGTVSFNSAQGSEVTATFGGYAAVASDQTTTS